MCLFPSSIFFSFSHQDVSIDFKKYERTFQRIKKGILPKNPQSVKEINEAFANEAILASYGTALQTSKKYLFFDAAIETANHSFCVLSSKATIELILEHIPPAERHMLMDGTFYICPIGPFKQILIIYIRRYHQVCITYD